MWLHLALTTILALLAAPCVVQRACRVRDSRGPPSVCMHRLHPADRQQAEDARAHKARLRAECARVLLPTLLRLSLAAVLLLVPLRVPHRTHVMLLLLLVLVAACQAAPDCKNCMMLGKEEKAMFRAHSDACLAQSQVDPELVESLVRGELVDEPRLRKHVYCVLLRCKLISKDGKLQKTAALGKMAARPDARNATKVLENCAQLPGDNPEDLAWNLFRCGYDKKAVLFNYMPATPSTGGAALPDNDAV